MKDLENSNTRNDQRSYLDAQSRQDRKNEMMNGLNMQIKEKE